MRADVGEACGCDAAVPTAWVRSIIRELTGFRALRKFKSGQRVRFFTGPEWVLGTIGQLGIEPDRYEVILDNPWRDDDTYWCSDVDLQPEKP